MEGEWEVCLHAGCSVHFHLANSPDPPFLDFSSFWFQRECIGQERKEEVGRGRMERGGTEGGERGGGG